MRNKESGFAVVEIFIVAILIVVVGFTGYFVWNKNNNTVAKETKDGTDRQNAGTEGINATKDSIQKEKTSTTSEVASSNILVSHNKKFSISLPDGWIVINDTELDYAHAIGLENMTYTKDNKAKIINELGLRGEGPTVASFVIQYGSFKNLENYYADSQETGTLTTDSGLVGKTYLYTAKSGPDEMLVSGSKSYGYKFDSRDSTAVIKYLKLPNDPDQKTIVENAIKSFKLL